MLRRTARPVFDEFWDTVIEWYKRRGREVGDKAGIPGDEGEAPEKAKADGRDNVLQVRAQPFRIVVR